ncbi:tryptophan 2,3-dioxygenase [Thermoflavimicrobium daqui]|uniref:Tryptophan 2,3-dioxygenase n=1 Tax=Thermoflavimicrobium daqui TaxID=2137476 RepID=A0A364K9Y5_9BACL|nr:tryptophan 2,3-dioxygenase [Thermoflavimicrobium daqui]RAL27116.1 tryptophan 2,3-dioxygenase [Thermoflavimicrobium daqui]
MSEKNKLVPEKGIHTDFLQKMTYGEYLSLDKILSAQNPLSGHHEEMVFLIIHQTSELWIKLMLHELNAATKLITQDIYQPAFKMLSRVSKIQSQIIQSWDILATMTPAEYMEFRDKLGNASGFQSYQYRLVEFAFGNKSKHILEIYKKDKELYDCLYEALYQPSLYDVSIQALAKAGLEINPKLLDRDWSEKYEEDPTVEAAWLEVYRNVDKYWNLYQLAEKLVDLEDWLQQWRFRHMKTVERIIGHKMGTGGSSGVTYLKKVLDGYLFPELWKIRTQL